ncbi:slipin family protein [Flavobacterium terrae]|uniref:SPFH domain / Band 7 family protein n=1 Tax=Flavobacterium terrae TaxID=415425 RepID=A0A1M6EIB8_9FLAO|nr:slipin family protein [Flavobacterium terrae]SHI85159.1 SPFH domain / Band 7 family protein [Flavobacterium terrae]
MLKRITIETFQVGLVFKEKKLIRVLTEGTYILFGNNKDIEYFSMKEAFKPNQDLDVLLKNETLAGMLQVVEVPEYQVALKFVNKSFKEVLTAGKYAFWKNVDDIQFSFANMTIQFMPPTNLDIMLQNETLATMLDVIEVADNEIALQYVNGNFKEIYTAGRYAFWKGVLNYKFVTIDLNDLNISEAIDKSILEYPKLKAFVRRYEVLNYEKGLLFINGEFIKIVEPGVYNFWNNANRVEIKAADLRQQQMEISGQELLTKDKANLRINFFVKYQVTDIQKALTENKDYEKQLYILMQLALRAYVGGFTLDELLTKKDDIAQAILAETKVKVAQLGVEVFDAGIRDIILPGDMKEIMNQVLVAEKKAQANTIMRREETASMRSMLNTAKLMEENEMLWKLKEMEYVEKIADRIGEITISGSGNIIGQLKEIFVK